MSIIFVHYLTHEVIRLWRNARAVPPLGTKMVFDGKPYDVFDQEWMYKNGQMSVLVELAPAEWKPRKIPKVERKS